MDAIIDSDGMLIIGTKNKEEADRLNEWYEQNPVSEDDAIKLQLNCLTDTNSKL